MMILAGLWPQNRLSLLGYFDQLFSSLSREKMFSHQFQFKIFRVIRSHHFGIRCLATELTRSLVQISFIVWLLRC